MAMLSIERLREIQPSLRDLPDAEVEKIRDDMDTFAEIIFDSWLEKKRKRKDPEKK